MDGFAHEKSMSRAGELPEIAFTSSTKNGIKKEGRCEKMAEPSVKTELFFLGAAPKNRVIFGACLGAYSS